MQKSKRKTTEVVKGKEFSSEIKNSPNQNPKAAKESSIPQNFNSYRHVITHSTNGDDLNWVLNLREKPQSILTPGVMNGIPPHFWNKQTESSNYKKTASEYDFIDNEKDHDHLIRRMVGPGFTNYSQGYFSSGLRKSEGIVRLKTLNRKNLLKPIVDRKGKLIEPAAQPPKDINKIESLFSAQQKAERGFWNHTYKDRQEFPKFLNEIKMHKQLATRYKTEIAEIQKVENPQERFKLKRKLP